MLSTVCSILAQCLMYSNNSISFYRLEKETLRIKISRSQWLQSPAMTVTGSPHVPQGPEQVSEFFPPVSCLFWIGRVNPGMKETGRSTMDHRDTSQASHFPLPKWLTGGSATKESARNAGDPGSIPGSGRSPKGKYSCLENPMDRGTWRATVHAVAKSQTWLSD